MNRKRWNPPSDGYKCPACDLKVKYHSKIGRISCSVCSKWLHANCAVAGICCPNCIIKCSDFDFRRIIDKISYDIVIGVNKPKRSGRPSRDESQEIVAIQLWFLNKENTDPHEISRVLRLPIDFVSKTLKKMYEKGVLRENQLVVDVDDNNSDVLSISILLNALLVQDIVEKIDHLDDAPDKLISDLNQDHEFIK